MMVYDITQVNSFETLLKIRSEFVTALELKEPDKFPAVLVGNKLDLITERKVPQDKAREWCKMHGGIEYLEVSAQKNEQVVQAFQIITKLMNGTPTIKPNWEYY